MARIVFPSATMTWFRLPRGPSLNFLGASGTCSDSLLIKASQIHIPLYQTVVSKGVSRSPGNVGWSAPHISLCRSAQFLFPISSCGARAFASCLVRRLSDLVEIFAHEMLSRWGDTCVSHGGTDARAMMPERNFGGLEQRIGTVSG